MIQDRDLWQFKLPDTKAFVAALYKQKFDMGVWEDLFYLRGLVSDGHPADHSKYDPKDGTQKYVEGTELLISQGEVLLEEQENRVNILEKHAHLMMVEGYSVPCVNANHFFASDLGNNLSKNAPFAASFTISLEKSQVFFSLRSSAESALDVNVAEIAEKFGGGGHKHAAGFAIPLNHVAFEWLSGHSSLLSQDFK